MIPWRTSTAPQQGDRSAHQQGGAGGPHLPPNGRTRHLHSTRAVHTQINLIARKCQTNGRRRTFYVKKNCTLQKWQCHKRQRKAMEIFWIKGD